MKGIFIAGTGTEVGKTMAAAGIMRNLRAQGKSAMIMKPVQTGADGLTAPDIDFVLQAAGMTVDEGTESLLTPYLFEPACSPHLAARMAGRPVRVKEILRAAGFLTAKYRMLVVEGAGGLMVPLNESETMLDLAAAFSFPVVLVGHSGLGTINHVLLSLDALRKSGLPVLGVILNDVGPVQEADRFIHDDNVQAVETFGKVRVLARIPWLGSPPDFALLDEAFNDMAGMIP